MLLLFIIICHISWKYWTRNDEVRPYQGLDHIFRIEGDKFAWAALYTIGFCSLAS